MVGTGVPAARRAASSTMPPFAPLPTAPGMVRAYVTSTLAAWGFRELTDVAELIASELTSNAVTASGKASHGTGTPLIRVCLITDGDVLTIEVWDQAPGVPVLRDADWSAETGRGLAIIDNLTGGAWGCQPTICQKGKCVWAELPLRDEPASPFLA